MEGAHGATNTARIILIAGLIGIGVWVAFLFINQNVDVLFPPKIRKSTKTWITPIHATYTDAEIMKLADMPRRITFVGSGWTPERKAWVRSVIIPAP